MITYFTVSHNNLHAAFHYFERANSQTTLLPIPHSFKSYKYYASELNPLSLSHTSRLGEHVLDTESKLLLSLAFD